MFPCGLINVCLAVKLIIPRIRLPRRETKKEQHRAKHSGASGIFAVNFLQFAPRVHPAFTHTRRCARKQRCGRNIAPSLSLSLSLSLSFSRFSRYRFRFQENFFRNITGTVSKGRHSRFLPEDPALLRHVGPRASDERTSFLIGSFHLGFEVLKRDGTPVSLSRPKMIPGTGPLTFSA